MQMWTQKREAIGSPVLGGGGAAAPTAGLAGGELPPTISSRVLSPFLLRVPQGPGVPDLIAKGGQGWRHEGGEVGTGGKGRMVGGKGWKGGKHKKGPKLGVFPPPLRAAGWAGSGMGPAEGTRRQRFGGGVQGEESAGQREMAGE